MIRKVFIKIFDRVVKERFELNDEIDHDNLIYHFKNNFNKKSNDFDNGIEVFKKVKSCEMKLKDEK